MFTGIITDIGTVLELTRAGDLRARIGTSYAPQTIALGASIACDGVCLTVIETGSEAGQNWFDVEISKESQDVTTIGSGARVWAVGRRINLERALKVGDELGGHLVSGHVDTMAEVIKCVDEGDSTRMYFNAPEGFARFIAAKGSVTLDGTSFTVNSVEGAAFDINVIPHTKEVTTWGEITTGDLVNLEIDTLARYVARLAETIKM